MENINQSFYLDREEPLRSCLLALRDIIGNQDKSISETTKYGMPCFCYKKKAFCYLWIDKASNEPYILMVEGRFINHPSLESGTRSKMKILRVNPNHDLPLVLIRQILDLGLQLYK